MCVEKSVKRCEHERGVVRQEFLSAAGLAARGSAREQVAWAFSVLDADRDGRISRADMENLCEAKEVCLDDVRLDPDGKEACVYVVVLCPGRGARHLRAAGPRRRAAPRAARRAARGQDLPRANPFIDIGQPRWPRADWEGSQHVTKADGHRRRRRCESGGAVAVVRQRPRRAALSLRAGYCPVTAERQRRGARRRARARH
ncbi:hypothetical protein ACJJTC_007677 [Scirpophaga incertulas]